MSKSLVSSVARVYTRGCGRAQGRDGLAGHVKVELGFICSRDVTRFEFLVYSWGCSVEDGV